MTKTAILLAIILSVTSATDYNVLLVQHLKNITNYSPLVLPRLQSTKVIKISMNMMVSHIVSVDTAKQSIRISAYIQARWEEERLVWNPADFGNVHYTRWDPTNIWYPMIMTHNGNGNDQILMPQIPVTLFSLSRNVTMVTSFWRREFEFFCSFNMAEFPYDEHTCELMLFFNDMGYMNSVLPVKYEYPMRVNGIYRPNNEWILKEATADVLKRNFSVDERSGPTEFSTCVLTLKLKRISAYYILNVITPLLLLTLLQALVYFVPLESGEKLGFGITTMLSYTVFLLLLDGILRKSENMPALAIFITAAMVFSTATLLFTSLTMRFHFTPDGTHMPACFRVVFVQFLGRLLCVNGSATPGVGLKQADEDRINEIAQKTERGVNFHASDWVVAARAIERFLALLGAAATAVIIGVFLVKPYR